MKQHNHTEPQIKNQHVGAGLLTEKEKKPSWQARLKDDLMRFCSQGATDIRLGRPTVETLVDSGLVARLSDLFVLDIPTLQKVLSEKRARTTYQRIQGCTHVGLGQFIYSFNIDNVCRADCMRLARHFLTIQDFLEATEQELADLLDCGVARDIVEHQRRSGFLIDVLSIMALGPTVVPVKAADRKRNHWRGKTFYLCGRFKHQSQANLRMIIRELGGSVTNVLSHNVDYVVSGYNGKVTRTDVRRVGAIFWSENTFQTRLVK